MSNAQEQDQKPKVLTDHLRAIFGRIINPMGEMLHKVGIHPDVVTFLGLVVVGIASFFIAQGQLRLGAIILLLGLPLDALDGAVARAMKRTGKFGAILDSTLDRYADGFIFAALSYYFAVLDQYNMFLLAQAALIGSLLVSYTRARAGGLKVDVEVGLFTRVERVVVILVMLFIPFLLNWGVGLLAIGTNITTFQRLWHVYNSLKNRGD